MPIWVLITMMAVLVGSFLVTRVLIGGVPALFTKTIASLGFVFGAVIAMQYIEADKFFIFITMGLVFGMIGDILLDLKVIYKQDSSVYLNYGMLVFALGHIMFFMALGNFYGFNGPVVGVSLISLAVGIGVSAIIVFVLGKLMGLDFGNHKWQSFAYSTILIFVMVLSLIESLKHGELWYMTAGLIAFLASDLVLSMQYFGGKEDDKVFVVVNHLLYYAAQTLIMVQLYCA